MYWIPKNAFRFTTLALLLGSATTAFSQDSASALDVLDLKEIERIADIARAGSYPRITSNFLSSQMATIISRLSCDSPTRVQLEDNLIAYFNGSEPAHIGPISND